MDIDEIKDSVKNFVDSRLKNPFFGSALVVWLVINKVFIFGIFNFDSTIPFKERLVWSSQQFQQFSFLFLHGFIGTVIYSLCAGFLVMVLYDKIGGLARIIYVWTHKSTIALIQKVEPSKWVEKNKFDEIDTKFSQSEDELNKKRLEYNNIQKEFQNINNQLQDIQKSKREIEVQLSSLINTNELQEGQLRQNLEEKKKFRVIYARFGKYEKYVEVTKTVSDLLHSKGSFIVDNSALGFDPYRNKIKDLTIEYEFNNIVKEITANEYELIEFKENSITSSETDESKEKQLWLNNQIEFANIFQGTWMLTYSSKDKNEKEEVKIDEQGNYYANGERAFNLIIKKTEHGNYILEKNRLNGDFHSKEVLNEIKGMFVGSDTFKNELRYEKIETINPSA